MMSQLSQKFAAGVQSRLAGYKFDPATLLALIQGIITMISNCKPPAKANVKAAVRDGKISPMQRGQVGAMALFHDFRLVRGHARDFADAFCDEAIAQQHAYTSTPGGLDFIDAIDEEAQES